MVKGIHHISLKCDDEETLEKVMDFYTGILGCGIRRRWEEGILFSLGNSSIEVFTNGPGNGLKGAIRHVAFAVDDVDGLIGKIREEGYPVIMEPKDIEIPLKARIAFCKGPMGEEIELFNEYENSRYELVNEK